MEASTLARRRRRLLAASTPSSWARADKCKAAPAGGRAPIQSVNRSIQYPHGLMGAPVLPRLACLGPCVHALAHSPMPPKQRGLRPRTVWAAFSINTDPEDKSGWPAHQSHAATPRAGPRGPGRLATPHAIHSKRPGSAILVIRPSFQLPPAAATTDQPTNRPTPPIRRRCLPVIMKGY